MYKMLTYWMVFISFSVFSQKEITNIERTNYENEVKQTILDFFEGFHKGDTIKMKQTMDQHMTLLTIVEKEGSAKTRTTDVKKFLDIIHNRPDDQKWDERLIDFNINADGHIANAWVPYKFYLGTNFSHCGINTFQLYHNGKQWKITNITDTRHKKGCKE